MPIHRSEKEKRSALNELKHMAESPYFWLLVCAMITLAALGVYTAHEIVAFAARRS
ncbi:MAG: hypothetical protein RLZZ342_118 [Candidatus Parcubacteria bacterium]|jgi:hypothetical protein